MDGIIRALETLKEIDSMEYGLYSILKTLKLF